MEYQQKIFAYCERGLDPSFWAEPVNALTNLGFIFASVIALAMLSGKSGEAKLMRYLLILNVFIIGVGSFIFHTYATRWASAADVIPIGVFMLVYLGYALYVFARVPLLVVIPAIAFFAYIIGESKGISCTALGLDWGFFRATNCLNGSFGYIPALGAMLLIGLWLGIRRHPAALYVFAAGLVFVVSVGFRATDRIWCNQISFMDKAIGTHFMWHSLNSVVLFLLLFAAVRHGGRRNSPASEILL
ncbi:MAG TPA: hypothetical protein VKA94_12780 [Hyphomicrobiales bacterium]|nr:hypothetical protein [Hyphomicrobiales bacterium]